MQNYEDVNSKYIKYANFKLKHTKNKDKKEYLKKYIADLTIMDYQRQRKIKQLQNQKEKEQ